MKFIFKDNKQLKNEFKKLAIDNNITMTEIANRCDLIPQQLNNRFNNSRISFTDIQQYCNAIGYDLVIDFVPKTDK